MKALGPRAHLPALHTIEVGKHASGEPYIVPDAALLKKAGLTRRAKIRLSLSHDREYAAASVIILGS